MANKPLRVYWDSCCYISCIEAATHRIDVLRKIIACAERSEIVLVASTIVIAEVTKLDLPNETSTRQAQMIRDFFENEYISVRPVDRKIAEEATKISQTYGLKPPDAIHLATAIRWQCDCLHTYDGEQGDPKKLLAFNGKIGRPAMPIHLPAVPQILRQGRFHL